MPRRPYVYAFVLMATLFVPVLFDFGVVAFVVPTVWGYASIFAELFRRHPHASSALACSIYSIIYTAIFYGCARLSFHALSFIRPKDLRLSFQILLLLGVLSCSFLRQLTYPSIQGQGGTYTFWEAIKRCTEKGHAR